MLRVFFLEVSEFLALRSSSEFANLPLKMALRWALSFRCQVLFLTLPNGKRVKQQLRCDAQENEQVNRETQVGCIAVVIFSEQNRLPNHS